MTFSEILLLFFLFSHTPIYFPAYDQAVVTGVVPSPARFLPSIFIAHRVQQSHCSCFFHRVLLTHALALSASQFALKQKSQRIYASMHSGGFEHTKLTYTRPEHNLIRHRGDRIALYPTQELIVRRTSVQLLKKYHALGIKRQKTETKMTFPAIWPTFNSEKASYQYHKSKCFVLMSILRC